LFLSIREGVYYDLQLTSSEMISTTWKLNLFSASLGSPLYLFSVLFLDLQTFKLVLHLRQKSPSLETDLQILPHASLVVHEETRELGFTTRGGFITVLRFVQGDGGSFAACLRSAHSAAFKA